MTRDAALPIAVNGAAGNARVVLKRGTRVIAATRIAIKSGQLTLKLPRKLASGKHVVAVTAGGLTASATINGPRAKAAAAVVDPRGLEPELP